MSKTATLVTSTKVTAKDYQDLTFANFNRIKKAELPKREPDFKSSSGSIYWVEKGYVYRYSTHFLRSVASCSWFLDGISYSGSSQGKTKLSHFVRKVSYLRLKEGKRYNFLYAAKDRKGVETVMLIENAKFLGDTSDYLNFEYIYGKGTKIEKLEKQRVSKRTYITSLAPNQVKKYIESK